MKLRVSPDFLEAARKSGKGIHTISMETASDLLSEVTVRTSGHKPGGDSTLENLTFRPGDPFVSGHAQVQVLPDGTSQGYFSIMRWVPFKQTAHSYAWAQQVWETGLLDTDEKMPPNKYIRYPFRDALPDNWKLPD
jgi:hypothetical protein